MEAFLASVVIFTLAILGMASGVIFGRRAFRGSCHGGCEQCDDTPKRDRPPRQTPTSGQASSPLPIVPHCNEPDACLCRQQEAGQAEAGRR